MADERSSILPLPWPPSVLPADLNAVVVLVVLTNLTVLLPVVRSSPLRELVGVAFVLFLPGYAVVSAMFPAAARPGRPDRSPEDEYPDMDDRSIDVVERVALSFGLSIVTVTLLGLAVTVSPWQLRLAPIVVSLSLVTLGTTTIAAVRRWLLHPDERFSVSFAQWLAAARAELHEPETETDAALNALLVLSVLLAVGSVGYVAVGENTETYTEFYLLTENESGELFAGGYPTEFERGESKPVVVGVENHERETVNYTVVVELQNVSYDDDEAVVHDVRRLQQFDVTLADNETVHRPYQVTPTTTGEGLRVTFLLYRGQPPVETSVDDAYRATHFRTNVSTPDGT